MIWEIIIVIGIFWIIQSAFAFVQNILIHNAIKELEKTGKVIYDRNAGLFKTKLILFLALNEEDTVVSAKKLRPTRFLIPPKLSTFNELDGIKMSSLESESSKFDDIVKNTLENLVRKYQANI